MLDFAEQTGSGIVIMVWSFLTKGDVDTYIYRRIHGFYDSTHSHLQQVGGLATVEYTLAIPTYRTTFRRHIDIIAA